MFNCQTKRAIVALFIYPEIPPCRVFFFWGPVIEFLFVYTIAQSRTIPATIAVFYRTICLPKPAQFSFFSRTLSEGLQRKLRIKLHVG